MRLDSSCGEEKHASRRRLRARRRSVDTRPRAFVFRRTRRSTRPASRFRDSSRVTPSRTRSAAASARVERVWSCCSPEDTSRSSPLYRHEVQGGADAPQGLRAPHQGVQRGTRRPPGARGSPRSLRNRPNRAKRSRRIRAARADWTFPARFWTAPSSSPRRDVPRARRKMLLVYKIRTAHPHHRVTLVTLRSPGREGKLGVRRGVPPRRVLRQAPAQARQESAQKSAAFRGPAVAEEGRAEGMAAGVRVRDAQDDAQTQAERALLGGERRRTKRGEGGRRLLLRARLVRRAPTISLKK